VRTLSGDAGVLSSSTGSELMLGAEKMSSGFSVVTGEMMSWLAVAMVVSFTASNRWRDLLVVSEPATLKSPVVVGKEKEQPSLNLAWRVSTSWAKLRRELQESRATCSLCTSNDTRIAKGEERREGFASLIRDDLEINQTPSVSTTEEAKRVHPTSCPTNLVNSET
jgi:hypothetical protein